MLILQIEILLTVRKTHDRRYRCLRLQLEEPETVHWFESWSC